MTNQGQIADLADLKQLIYCVLNDRRFCSDEFHKTFAEAANDLIAENDRLKTENEALRDHTIYWQCAPGIGLIRCVPDARYRKFSPKTRMRYSPVALIGDPELRKDAERYRWFRDHSIQIVHTATICWAFHLDKLIDDAMSPGYYAIRNQPGEV